MKFTFPKIQLENKLVSSTLITAIILLFVGTLSYFDPFSILEYSNLGVRNILLSGNTSDIKINPNLVLVKIDNKTLRDENKENPDEGGLGRWQDFDREYYAKVIKNLNDAGAIAIGMDIMFSEKAKYGDGDKKLEAALKEAGNVILGMSLGSIEKNGDKIAEPIFPLKEFSDAAYDIGYFQPIQNPINGFVYSINGINEVNGKSIEPFSLATLRKYLSTIYDIPSDEKKEPNTGKIHFYGDYELQKSQIGRNDVLIQYLRPGQKFEDVSFVDVYNNNFNKNKVKDKIVFIGTTATALHDEFLTPIGIIPGVEVHMNFVNTVLNNSYSYFIHPTTEMVIIILLTFGLTLLLINLQNRIYQVLYSLLFLILGSFFYVIVYQSIGLIFTHPTEIIIIIVIIAIAVTLYKFIYEEKGKRMLRNALSQYLSEEIVGRILTNYDGLRLGGTRKEVTLFFSDIAGFTTISENMEPEELVNFLSTYLKEVSDIILHGGGFINKYEGDAVMAIWGAFVEDPKQSCSACKSALLQQSAIAKLNIHLKSEFGFEISVRMGLNKGIAVVGNIGSQGKKLEYTALGDTVNTASRFEGINKMYGTLICTGESIAKDEAESFVFRKIDSIMVKGKNKPVLIFELICDRREGPDMDPIYEKIAKYEKAFEHYQKREFLIAKPIFEELIASHQDGPSVTMLERTNNYLENGCPDDWEGHYRATEK